MCLQDHRLRHVMSSEQRTGHYSDQAARQHAAGQHANFRRSKVVIDQMEENNRENLVSKGMKFDAEHF